MLAPEPFFEPRGTPFSEYHRIKALGELGHHVDLVTYPIGRDVELPNLRIFRSLRPPFVPQGPHRSVGHQGGARRADAADDRCGASGRSATTPSTRTRRWGWSACGWRGGCGIPHLYDMHSSLPQQLSNFKYSRSSLLRRVFAWAEGQMVHKSDVVITICQELQDTVDRDGRRRAVAADRERDGRRCRRAADAARRQRSARRGALPPTRRWRSTRHVRGVSGRGHADRRGGDRRGAAGRTRACSWSAASRRRWTRRKARARAAGARRVMVFTGQQPAREIPGFVQAADLLVSPRIRGTNTPLKIYSYLRSGKPIVATNLLTHTQVLTPEIARLVDARGRRRLPAAMLELIDQPDDARARWRPRRAAWPHEKYSRESYLRRTAEAYARLAPSRRAAPRSTGARSWRAGEGAGHRRHRLHRWPPRAASGRRAATRCGRWCGRRAARGSIDRRWPPRA